jgi:hypothetical protein
MKSKSSRRKFLQAGLSLPAAGFVISPISAQAALSLHTAFQEAKSQQKPSGSGFASSGNVATNSKFEKHIARDLWHKSYPEQFHPEVTAPVLGFRRNKEECVTATTFGFSMVPITKAFEMAPKPHVHDFDEFLMFLGGDIANLLTLGGEVEFSLGDSENNLEKFVFTKPTICHLTTGVWHCPLNFKRVDNPAKPVLFINLMFPKPGYMAGQKKKQ